MDREKNPNKNDRDIMELDDFFSDFWPTRSRRGLFGGLFDEFDDQFRKMEQKMNRLYKNALSGKLPSPQEGGPHVYGWTFKMGPDGKPHFQEFGNMPNQLNQSQQEQIEGTREPLVDIQESDKELTVIAEVPGVQKKDAELEVDNNTLTIKVDSKERKYYKEVQLPAEVDPDKAEATFNNGVLSIKLKRLKPKKKGTKIKVK